MQDIQNYQYYDPSPQPPPVKWWQRGRVWKVTGLTLLALVIMSLAAVAAVNLLQNRSIVKENRAAMDPADTIESQLMTECDTDDQACLDRARADAARTLGLSQACDELSGEALTTCVNLIAQDTDNPDACNTLADEDRVECLDMAYMAKAQANGDLNACDQITDASTGAACRIQIREQLSTAGDCSKPGVDKASCDSAAAVEAAILSGDPAVCAALPEEQQQLDCEDGIYSVDDDHDGLVLADEVSKQLSDNNKDFDADGLTDGDEVHQYSTDPGKADTDVDGFSDGTEVQSGYDPLR